MTDHALLECLL